MKTLRTTLSALVLVLVMIPTAVIAAPGGNGNGKGNHNGSDSREAAAACVVNGNMVEGHNLPGDEVINFMITEPDGTTHGWVLGINDAGWWYVMVPDRTGPTTYEFVSRTWGPGGSKYRVFASCTAGV